MRTAVGFGTEPGQSGRFWPYRTFGYAGSWIWTSMRRRCLSSRRGGPSVAERNGFALRALCFYPHFR
jgi:hypothetical protein